jgi:hypothetical protein
MADTPDQPARVKMLRPLGLARIDRNEFGGAGIAVPGLAGLWMARTSTLSTTACNSTAWCTSGV